MASRKKIAQTSSPAVGAAHETAGSEVFADRAPARLIVTLTNGQRFNIVSEDGKYYYGEQIQLRKGNPMIAFVKAR